MAAVESIRPVFMFGLPSYHGGASSERWHTLKLWRRMGLDVTVVDSGVAMPDHDEWESRLTGLCIRVLCEPDFIALAPYPDRIAVSFCDSGFRRLAPTLRSQLKMKTIYCPCMCAPYPEEKYSQPLADRYVFQTEFQRDHLLPALGLPEGTYRVIRGAFDVTEFKYNPKPHAPGDPFVVGKLATNGYTTDGTRRPASRLEKWPAGLWKQYEMIPYRPLQARVMGWTDEIQTKCGAPPEWATVLPQGAETAQQFLESIHCLVPGIGCCFENWPRVALEARAVGTPVIAEYRGGWKEMMRGCKQNLVATPHEQAYMVSALAYGSPWPWGADWIDAETQEHIGNQWLDLFTELSA